MQGGTWRGQCATGLLQCRGFGCAQACVQAGPVGFLVCPEVCTGVVCCRGVSCSTHTVGDVALFPSVHVCLLLRMNGPDRACLSSACPSLSVCPRLHESWQRRVRDELSPPCQVPTWSRTWSYSSSLGSPCSSWSWRWGSGSAGAASVSGITSVPALGASAMPAAW